MKNKSWYKIEAKADESATVYIYDEIGYWGITAKDFIREVDALNVGSISLRVNSPGGDVFDGIAIYNALNAHPAQVETQIDGLAASIASIIAMAGDKITIAKNAFFMIHNAWAVSIGDAEAMRKMSDVLDKIDTTLVKTYAERTGQSQRNIRQMMGAETWMNADEAIERGFADQVTEETGAKAAFDLSKFRNVPKDINTSREVADERTLEKALRDAGLSQIAAKAAISAAKSVVRRDDGDESGAAEEFLTNLEITNLINKFQGDKT